MITWHVHRRTRQLCKALDFPLYEIESELSRFRRYWGLLAQTFQTIKKQKPDILVVQNPSLVLALQCYILRAAFGFRLVVDAHNEAIQPIVHNGPIIRALARFIVKRADLTIVTNSGLAGEVERIGGAAFVLPDAIPIVPACEKQLQVGPTPTVLVISTVAPDEPLDTVLEAARMLPDLQFFITGSVTKFHERYGSDLPENVHLTGYVADAEYWVLLRRSSVIVDLTTMPDCLVCGAYEAIAVGTPMILTKNRATLELFGECAKLTENDAGCLAESIFDVIENLSEWRRVISVFRKTYEQKWQEQARSIIEEMHNL